MQTAPVRFKGRKRSFHRLFSRVSPGCSGALRRAGRLLPGGAAFFLLSIAQCFSVPAPYALCCLIALVYEGIRPRGAWLGLGLGLGCRLLWGIDPDLGQYAACLLCLPLMRFDPRTKGMRRLIAVLLLLVRALPGALRAANAQQLILQGAGLAMGLAALPALRRAARLLHAREKELTGDDLLCLLLPGLLLLTGAARLSLAGLNVGYMLSVFTSLLLSWMLGGKTGVCAGLCCGLALMTGGQSALYLVNLTFGGLLAGLLQGKPRPLASLGYLLASLTAAYLSALNFYPPLFFATAVGALAFSLLPERALRRLSRLVRKLVCSRPQENAYTRLRMQRWVRAIDSIAAALPHPQPPAAEETGESEAVSERLCQECDRLPICWRDQYEQTKAGMEALARRETGDDGYLDVINRYFSACTRISRIPGILEELDEKRRQATQRVLCADYERDMLQTHLTALSQAAQRISLEGALGGEEENEWLALVEEALQSLRFPGRAAFVKKVDGRMLICLQYEPLALRPTANDGLARHIGVRLGLKLQVTEQSGGRILLEEEPPLRILTGMATACAVSPERKRAAGKPLDNGDAVLVEPLSGGRVLLALSDGMGHGTGAQHESKKTLELLSLCMEAGYTRAQAMTAVNGSMLSATGGEKFATVDLCLVDLWSGEAAMNKLGACASLLAQGQKIQWIEGAALPLGIIEHVVPMEHRFSLGEGDLLLLMSDGIMDAFENEEDVTAILRQCRGDTPQHIADAILREALAQRDGLPPDDMTVLCGWVYQPHAEKKRSAEIA